ncbi:MAG: lytic transglycosylase domain-containing protein [Bryobacteraceae bacterium]
MHDGVPFRVFPYKMPCVRILALALAAVPLMAGEYAILSNGQMLRADRHERAGDLIRLFQDDGVTEVPAALVTGFEVEETARPAPQPPMPVAARREAVPADASTLVRDAARRSGLPPEFVESVAKVESAMRADAVSPKGAIGVMQLMPDTAKSLGADPHDLAQNIDAGTRLLRELLLKYDGDVVKALAAYNAGEGAVDRYRGLPPYNETRQYVNKVIGVYKQAGGQ